jgi:hypothetical protein
VGGGIRGHHHPEYYGAANGLGAHPRAVFDKAVLRTLLNLKDTQNPILELPVGYPGKYS